MTVETALYPNQLNASWPLQSDIVREGAGHLRLLKSVLKTTFPNVTGAVSASHIELSRVSGLASPVQPQLDALATGKGSVSGQTWTGTHVYPSTTTIGPLTPTIQTWLAGVTSDVQIQIDAKSTKTGDTYSGAHNFTGATVTVPTATAGDATNAAASTAFVSATAFSAALPGQTGNAGKYVKTNGFAASWEYVLSEPLTGLSLADGSAVTAADTVLQAFGKLQAGKASLSALDALLDVPTSTVTSGPYTLQLADRGKCVDVGHAITVPTLATAAFPKGSVVNLQNVTASGLTITAQSGATVYLAGDSTKTGPFTLKGYGWVVLRKIDSASTWVISGAGL